MISPLRYPGGKAKLYPFFSELIRLNSLYNCTYAEPYAGGAGLALKLLSHGFVSRVEINDVDLAIASFWRAVLGSTERFCDRIMNVDLSTGEWLRQREIYRRGAGAPEFELGFAAYYLNRTSRSGIIEGSGPIGGYEQKGEWKIDARFNRRIQVDQVSEIGRHAAYINVTNLDALVFCKQRIMQSDTLTYLDPPYYVKGHKLYKNFYKDADHRVIAKFMQECRDGNWILSYDYANEIIAMYSSFAPVVYQLSYSAGRTASGTEVIFAGSKLALPTTEFLPRAA